MKHVRNKQVFPFEYQDHMDPGNTVGYSGLTYREWLIGTIAAGYATRPGLSPSQGKWTTEDRAQASIALADEIIKKLEVEDDTAG